MNNLLLPIEKELIKTLVAPVHPVIFIVGPPRSGTTLVSQLLSHSGGFGYISNFLARFWNCPTVGAKIESSLGIREPSAGSAYTSEYGVTSEWGEPHEFGYFWDRWFDLGQEVNKLTDDQLRQVDVDSLKQSVAGIEKVQGKPMVFKNSTWCTFQIEFLANVFPSSVFVSCERDPLYAGQSILNARRRRLGDQNLWWSIRPAEYQRLLKLSPFEQVIGQVAHTYGEIDRSRQSLDSDRFVNLSYSDLCDDPREQVRRIGSAVLRNSYSVTDLAVEKLPEHFESTDSQRLNDEDWKLLREASAKFTAGVMSK